MPDDAENYSDSSWEGCDSSDDEFSGFSDLDVEETQDLQPKSLAAPSNHQVFDTYEELFTSTQEFAKSQGYALTTRRSRRGSTGGSKVNNKVNNKGNNKGNERW